MGASWWRLAHLPHAGGMGDQDAVLMGELEVVRDERNRILAEEMERQAGEQSLKRWRERVRRERG